MNSTEETRRSRLSDYAEMTGAAEREHKETPPDEGASSPLTGNSLGPSSDDELERGLREFAVRLGEFRRTAVLVPVDEHGVPLTGDYGGVRWIYAFSSEAALARYALARGEGDREWPYQKWLGARLLDAAVPAVGVPCGVALDVGGAGALFPPVAGIVPDRAAVDVASELGAAR
ncbi:hypothetical protein [Streptomyces sp. AM6-12]|uniref:hypothetical protein n=1 Tax=Streptomyces sp. AM6-12 TaxID=3345149 RepID=UPI003790B4A1